MNNIKISIFHIWLSIGNQLHDSVIQHYVQHNYVELSRSLLRRLMPCDTVSSENQALVRSLDFGSNSQNLFQPKPTRWRIQSS